MDVGHLRRDYENKILNSVLPDPLEQFAEWLKEAIEKKAFEPNAMILATAHGNQPSTRTVLLKEITPEGFIFYTNYLSRKAKEIAHNPLVSATFLWHELSRQVNVWAVAEKITRQQSERYFQSRPRLSQIAAWASMQDEEIASHEELHTRFQEYEKKYLDAVPTPPHWGGFILKPNYFEFWQGQPNRLHDRFCYKKILEEWQIQRLMP